MNIQLIDPFKVSTAILSGVQNYWGERAAKHKLQMVDISFDGRSWSGRILEGLLLKLVVNVILMPRQAEEVLQYEDFLSWTVSPLKDFLSLRGLKQTGRKPELVARAFGAYELKAPVKFSQEQIYKQIKEEYSRR